MKPLVAIDIETKDLSARYDKECPVWSVATYGHYSADQSFMVWSRYAVDQLNELLPRITPVFHNASFDIPALRLRGVDIPRNTPSETHWYDTMAMSYALQPSEIQYHSLGALASLVDEVKDDKPNFSDPDPVHLEKYNVQDARITYKLADFFLPMLRESEENWHHFHEIELPYIEIIMALEQGITVNRKELALYEKQLSVDTKIRLADIRKAVGFIPGEVVEYSRKTLLHRTTSTDKSGRKKYTNTFTGVNRTTKDGKTTEVYDHCVISEFNPNSGDHIADLLINEGWTPTVYTKTDKPKTDAKTLEPLQLEYPIVKEILEYKKLETQLTTFVRPIGEFLDKNSILRGSFNQFTTATRRLSSSKPNLQNIPARGLNGQLIRKMFVARPGHKLVVGDLDRIEVCVLAFYLEMLFGDTTMADAVRAGIDVHQVNADNWGIIRALAKNVFFCLLYGGGAQRIAITGGVSLQQGKQILASIEKSSPAIFDFRDYVVDMAVAGEGYFNDWLGAQYYVPDIMSPQKSVHHAARRKIANYVIQGSAGSIFKELQLRAHHTVEEFEAREVIVVHDEAIYEVCEHYAPLEFAENLSDIYTTSDILVSKNIIVPISAKFHVADNWYDAKTA